MTENVQLHFMIITWPKVSFLVLWQLLRCSGLMGELNCNKFVVPCPDRKFVFHLQEMHCLAIYDGPDIRGWKFWKSLVTSIISSY